MFDHRSRLLELDIPCREEDNLQCPGCFKRTSNLGELSRHWDKSCSRKSREHGALDDEGEGWLGLLKKRKREASRLLERALNRASSAPRAKVPRRQRAVSKALDPMNGDDCANNGQTSDETATPIREGWSFGLGAINGAVACTSMKRRTPSFNSAD